MNLNNIYLPANHQKIDDIPIEDEVLCDYCQTVTNTEDDESRTVSAGDESMTMCEGCASHYLD